MSEWWRGLLVFCAGILVGGFTCIGVFVYIWASRGGRAK